MSESIESVAVEQRQDTASVTGIPAVQEHGQRVVVDPFAPVMVMRHADGESLARENEGLRLQVAEYERELAAVRSQHAAYREQAEDTRRALEQRIVSLESVQRGYANDVIELRAKLEAAARANTPEG